MPRRTVLLITAIAGLALPASVAAHTMFDHAPPSNAPSGTPPAQTAQAGGPNAAWEFVTTIPTGNPHTDLDFFRRNGETFLSVGTLAIGANGGGQTIVQLTDKGKVTPKLLASHPSATCLSNPSAATALQHDVEATPKGGTILNTPNAVADAREAQLLVDATDGEGRCHDQGSFGLNVAGPISAPQGGLEIVDVTDPAHPNEIGLTSHIGEAHTVNIDPKRPHIAYAVTSDEVTVKADGTRENEDPADSDRFDLDGFEVVDMRSCMNFPAGATEKLKRDTCRPQVYRYRYPSTAIALGHTRKNAVFGCHELEIYPDDRLSCASGAATILFDMKDAFDDNGTPSDFTDDRPKGTPLPCAERPSSTVAPQLKTGATVMDCVTGVRDGKAVDLTVPGWIGIGSPSLEGVKHLGTAFHQGRFAGTGDPQANARPAFDSTQDVDFSHEAELTESGRYLLASDERGGGILPPGASCDTADNVKIGNGGISFYPLAQLRTTPPASAEEAFASYAKTDKGDRAIYRVPIRTGAEATICTSHVYQQVPGQNRIFMAWYSQGTQVFDFTENPDGTLTFKEAGYFIPAQANQWVSHIFKADRNPDGSFTYYGAAGDFNLGEGRSAVDVYKVTLPAPPVPRIGQDVPAAGLGTAEQGGVNTDRVPAACAAARGLGVVRATRSGSGVTLRYTRDSSRPVDVDVFRVSQGRRVLTERLVRRYRGRKSGLRWNGRDRRGRTVSDGTYVVRFRVRGQSGGRTSLRLALQRSRGRFSTLPDFERREDCGVLTRFKLERPVFGGSGRTSLRAALRFRTKPRSATVQVVRAATGRVVATRRLSGLSANRTVRPAFAPGKLPRGRYEVRVRVEQDLQRTTTATLTARRI